jgi:hypothetical protein
MKMKNTSTIHLLFILGLCLLLSISCKKKDDNNNDLTPTPKVPELTTTEVTDITLSSATSGGNITSPGSSGINVRGVCWSTSQNPSTSDNFTVDSSGIGVFTSYLSDLTTNTPYYVRAYTTNSAGTGYGNQVSFTTKKDTNGTLVSIGWLKNWYNTNHPVPVDTLRITSKFIIEGIVSATDESGNIYKTLYIQDSTSGITVSLDQTSLYKMFPIGQKVRIICKDLYMGTYGTAIQLGCIYNGTIGRIPAAIISSHLFIDGLPGPPPQPFNINTSHIPDITTLTNLVSSLVALNGVSFPDAGLPFCIQGNTFTSRAIGDSTGTAITDPNVWVIYTSSYSYFNQDLLPAGIGTLQGILTVYNGKFEVIVRDRNDLINFHLVK